MSENYRRRIHRLVLSCAALMMLVAGGGCERAPAEEAGGVIDGAGRTTPEAVAPSAPETPCSDDAECASDNPCITGECDEESGACRAAPVDDGTACDDGRFCTVGDRCVGGACEGAARICEAADGACAVAWCDEANDTCSQRPRRDGTACGDDGDLCTTGRCVDGACEVEAVDCSHLNDGCRVGSCDEETGGCTYQWLDADCVPG